MAKRVEENSKRKERRDSARGALREKRCDRVVGHGPSLPHLLAEAVEHREEVIGARGKLGDAHGGRIRHFEGIDHLVGDIR